MKNKIKILTILFLSLMIWSCENELTKKVEFNVSASTDDNLSSSSEITVDSGNLVTFNFTGDPDFITFYSGEPGHEYSKKDLLTIPSDEITSKLKFTAEPQWGKIEGTLKVFLSTSFQGLRGNDKQKDSVAILANNWKDISDVCNLPTVNKEAVDVEVPIDEYLGKKLTIAFHYKPETNTTTQPTWIISGLNIENTLKSTNGVSKIVAASMGFQAFDMVSSTPYLAKGGSGVWNLSKIKSQIRIQSSPSDAPLNNDWLISNPIVINSRKGDKGTAIKKVSIDLDSYKYTFKKPGTYTVTFVAKNANYKTSSEIIKHITVKVQK